MKNLKKAISFYSSFIHSGNLCYDIGANIGNRVKVFTELGARVIACEPQPGCIKNLRKKFSNKKDVVIVQTALGKESGEGFLRLTKKASTIASMNNSWINKVKENRFKNYNWDRQIKVPIICIDKLIIKNNREVPFFIKIDVEGFEYEVLQGLHHSVPYISFEYVPEILSIAINCINYLKYLDCYEFNYSVEESFIWGLENWVNADTIIDIIKHQDIKSFGDIYARIS